jgi:hypothetical protein
MWLNNHRCTRVENPGEGVALIFFKAFLKTFINKVFEKFPGGQSAVYPVIKNT